MKAPNGEHIAGLRATKNGLASIGGLCLIGLAVVAAVVLLIREGTSQALQSIRLDPLWLILSFLTACFGLWLAAFVWHRVLGSFGVHQPFRATLRVYCYSAIGVALPGSIWPIAGRSLLSQQNGISGLRVATASVIESFVIGVSAMVVYAGCIALRPGTSLWTQPWVGIGFSLLAGILICPPVFNRLSRWLLRRTKRVADPIAINVHLRELVGWGLVESVIVVMGGIALFFVLSSLVSVPGQTLLLLPLIIAWAASSAVGNLFFWLPATSLLRDGALILALTPTLPTPLAILFVVLVRVWSIGSLLLIAGFIWLWLDCPLWNAHRFGGQKPPEPGPVRTHSRD